MSHRVIATAGHVDHGKSTLLRALTGMEPDRLAEERRRGLSVDLGFVWTTLEQAADAPPVTVAFVDVPGHERFVPTMLAGAGSAPAALFVVAATDGWSQQSAEHLDVLDLLEVPAVAVAITKSGLVTEERVDAVRAEVTERIAGTSLADAPLLVVDAVEGRGLDELRAALASRLAELPPPVDLARPRLWVDRSFSVAGAGTVVTGTLTEGSLGLGDTVRILPGASSTRLRRVQALGRDVERAEPGTRVALNIGGVERTEVGRGDVVVGSGPWRVTRTAELWVRTTDQHEIGRSGAWHLHVGSASTPCRLLPITAPIEPGSSGVVRALLARPLPLVAGDRVVLREAGRRATVAGGRVVDPAPRRRPRGRAERAAHATALAELAHAPRSRRLLGLVELAGGGLDDDDLRAAVGWSGEEPLPTGVTDIGGLVVNDALVAGWEEVVRRVGAGIHDRSAIEALLQTAGDQGRGAGSADLDRAVRAAPDHLVARGSLVRVRNGYALPDQVDDATAARRERARRVVEALESSPFAPPDLQDVAREVGLDHREIAGLVQSGDVVRCGGITFTPRSIEMAIQALEPLAAEGGRFTAAEAKRQWGTTRRYAIPLLEHLDRIGATSFDGQHRTLTRQHQRR